MASKVSILPKDIGSLSGGLPSAAPGTLFVLGPSGGMSVAPDADFPLTFGRNEPDVHVCVGMGDECVSRCQGLITYARSRWTLSNTGKRPIRFPGSRLVLKGDQAELATGYTPLFIVSPRQEHLLEIRIASVAPPPAAAVGTDAASHACRHRTSDGDTRDLAPEEKLVLICLAQRYLRNDPQPQPLTWSQVAYELTDLNPTDPWSPKRAAHVVAKVRRRLSSEAAITGLLGDDVPSPVGNALNHNLIADLLLTTTITKADLRLLGE
ncbi:hypothetical protein [Streptomyces sp. NBC_01477]|uniref:hypothetical protein n=1 Tax=Streptomyces sp. NBC_01477 TaxID=2976015 RepID=UPI002E30CF1C|nr:hypothetical protein [Streptomyces sp. NBC_01477]